MPDVIYQDLGDGIYCIETELLRQGLAACYLLTAGDQAAFVDTGTYNSVPNLLQTLSASGLSTVDVRYIIPTHVHLDHAGGAGELMRLCPNATLIVHPKGAPHMIDPSKLIAGATAVYGEDDFANYYGTLIPVDAARVHTPADGEMIDFNGRTLQFFDTPGHANHHLCIFDEQTQSFFTGDTFGLSYREFDTEQGAWVCATTSPVAFDPDAWQSSLDKIMQKQPRAMQLTHYCRVTDVARLCQDLRDSIKAMRDIALQEEASEQRQAVIYERLMDLVVASAQAHKPTMSTAEARDLLCFDIDLNAQGLDIWLKRRAKQQSAAQ